MNKIDEAIREIESILAYVPDNAYARMVEALSPHIRKVLNEVFGEQPVPADAETVIWEVSEKLRQWWDNDRKKRIGHPTLFVTDMLAIIRPYLAVNEADPDDYDEALAYKFAGQVLRDIDKMGIQPHHAQQLADRIVDALRGWKQPDYRRALELLRREIMAADDGIDTSHGMNTHYIYKSHVLMLLDSTLPAETPKPEAAFPIEELEDWLDGKSVRVIDVRRKIAELKGGM